MDNKFMNCLISPSMNYEIIKKTQKKEEKFLDEVCIS